MKRRLAVLGVAGIAVLGTLSGCGLDSKITADTTCGDYLEKPADKRRDATMRISSERGVKDASDPNWWLSLDYTCGSSADATVGDVLARLQR